MGHLRLGRVHGDLLQGVGALARRLLQRLVGLLRHAAGLAQLGAVADVAGRGGGGGVGARGGKKTLGGCGGGVVGSGGGLVGSGIGVREAQELGDMRNGVGSQVTKPQHNASLGLHLDRCPEFTQPRYADS